MRIVPFENKNLVANVCISESDVDGLEIGQSVKIKLNALNSNEYGQVKGIVTRIGADTLYDSDRKPYYEVCVKINENYLKDRKNGIACLRSGMTGCARIKIKNEKLLKYICSKLF